MTRGDGWRRKEETEKKNRTQDREIDEFFRGFLSFFPEMPPIFRISQAASRSESHPQIPLGRVGRDADSVTDSPLVSMSGCRPLGVAWRDKRFSWVYRR